MKCGTGALELMISSMFSKKGILVVACAAAIFLASCSFSVRPVYNAKAENTPQTERTPAQVTNRDDLKAKAIEQVKRLHRLTDEGKFEEAYQMIDDKSALKLPKDQALRNMQEGVDTLGKLEKMELTRDSVVDDKSLNGGQLQVRQEFIVKFEKDTPSPKRYELFIWNVYPDGTFKLWAYMNSKGDD